MYTPNAWDFVWCNFPFDQDLSSHDHIIPGRKPRPVMIVKAWMDTESNVPWVGVIYGTSNMSHYAKYGFEIHRRDRHEFIASGLDKDTKFDAGKVAYLPLTKAFFPNAPVKAGIRDGRDCFLGTARESVRIRYRPIFKAMVSDRHFFPRIFDASATPRPPRP